MLDQRLRPRLAAVLHPFASGSIGRVPPLVLTAIGLVVGLGAAAAAALGLWELALVAWVSNRFLDALDGQVARLGGASSDRGGYLDMCADVVVYAAIPLGVAIGVDERSVWVAVAVLLASFYVNTISWAYLSALLEKRGRGASQAGESTSITMPPGLVEGAETFVLMSALLVLPEHAAWIMGAMAAAVALGAAIRIAQGATRLSP